MTSISMTRLKPDVCHDDFKVFGPDLKSLSIARLKHARGQVNHYPEIEDLT